MVKETRSSTDILKEIVRIDKEIKLFQRKIIWNAGASKVTKAESLSDARFKSGEMRQIYYNITDGTTARYLDESMSLDDFESNNFVLLSRGKPRYSWTCFMDTKYIPEINCVVIGFFCCDFFAPKKGKAMRPFTEKARYYIDANKRIYKRATTSFVYCESSQTKPGCVYESKIANVFDYFLDMARKNTYQFFTGYEKAKLVKPMTDLFGPIAYYKANTTLLLSNPSSWSRFLKYRSPSPCKDKRGKKIAELTLLKLAPIPKASKLSNNIAYIQKIADNIAVLRTMENSKELQGEYMAEKARIYATDQEIIACRPTDEGYWVPIPLKSKAENWNYSVPYFNEESVKGTLFERYSDLLSEITPSSRSLFLASCLTYPWIEKIFRSPLKEWAKPILENGHDIIHEFNLCFGGINTTENKINNIVGLNKHQMKKLGEMGMRMHTGYSSYVPVGYIKGVFNNKICDYEIPPYLDFFDNRSIANIDDKTFDEFLNAYTTVCINARGRIYAFCLTANIINNVYGTKAMIKSLPLLLSIYDKSINIEYKDKGISKIITNNALDVYKAYLTIVGHGNMKKIFSYKFDIGDPHSIQILHDSAYSVFYTLPISTSKTYFSRIGKCEDPLRKHFIDSLEYEEEEFCVIAPPTLGSVVAEGISLHNFAKNSAWEIARGNMNIVFIRKTEAKEESFYTVVINKYKKVVKIAGFSSYFPSGNQKLLDFIDRWCKEKKLFN